MKKTSIMIIIIIFILSIVTACTHDNGTAKLKTGENAKVNSTSKANETAKTEKSDMKLTPVQIAANGEIIFFTNQKIYYFTGETHAKTPDLADETLNEYDIKSKTRRVLNKFDDISTYSGSFVLNHNTLYMPLATNVQNFLVKADMEKGDAIVVKKWKSFPPFVYVYSLENNLILSGLNEVGETMEYNINKMNLDTNKEENIIKKKMKNLNGEIIGCIDVQDEYIYTFSLKVDGNSEKYKISRYNSDGKLLSSYPFDLKFYLGAESLRGQEDAILNLYKEKDYFILNTLSGRVFIFKITNNVLQPVKIPEKLYKDDLSGFHFLEYYDGVSDFAYFVNAFKDNNTVMVFNYTTEAFTSLEFPKNNGVFNEYHRNADGDLIMKKSSSQSTNEFQYFYYRKESESLN